jgi:hypothetical protein
VTAPFEIRRGEKEAIGFNVTDPVALALGGKRITLSICDALALVGGVPQTRLGPAILRKVSALPGATADVSIEIQVAGQLKGVFNLTPADYTLLTKSVYAMSVWVDDGAGGDRCATASGYQKLVILETASRT